VKPVLALVGRPNVGKSTLFNRLTKSRDAIVADFAGLTRDRHYGNARQGKREFIVIDTGGFEPTAESGIYMEMARQTRQAVAEADVVIFVLDARGGLTGQDHDIARYLRKLGKPTVLAVNKAEGMTEGVQLTEFYELGLGEVHPISAAHGQGIRSLIEVALAPLNLPDEDDADEAQDPDVIKLAVAGRPNVGKSTLINTWLGEERLVAFDQPGIDRPARHHPRRDLGAVRARRPEVRADRHGRAAPQGQGVRGDREVLGGQDAPGDRVRQCRAAAVGRDPGRHRPGRPHRRLQPR
jgi:GTP-binding protein